jgi:hypothetical protein
MYDMTDDWQALEIQATETAAYFLRRAIYHIDENFAEGYAMNHPELVIAFMNICERDFANAGKSVRHHAEMEMRERELDLREREGE